MKPGRISDANSYITCAYSYIYISVDANFNKTSYFAGFEDRYYEIQIARPNFIQNEPAKVDFHRLEKIKILVCFRSEHLDICSVWLHIVMSGIW